MKARYTIIVATLLASSVFGAFFQDRDIRTPKDETDDLRRSNRDLARQMAKEPESREQPAHELELNSLRARTRELEARARELERQLAAKVETVPPAKPVDGPSTNRVEGTRRFGPPTFAELEEMRKNDPERYVQTTNRFAQFRVVRQERLQNQFDILASADTAHMTEKQRKVHKDYINLLARISELGEQLNPLADVTEEQRRAASQEMREAWHQLHELQLIERDTLLIQMANALGFHGPKAQEVVEGIKRIYEATGGSQSRRGRRGQIPDQSLEKEGINTSIKIQIGRTRDMKDAFVFNGTEVDFKRLDELIKTTAATRPEERVFVYGDANLRHKTLVQVLDICKKYNIKFSIIPVNRRKE